MNLRPLRGDSDIIVLKAIRPTLTIVTAVSTLEHYTHNQESGRIPEGLHSRPDRGPTQLSRDPRKQVQGILPT